MSEILILYYSHMGAVRQMAQLIARGVNAVPGASARIRTVPKISTVCETTAPDIPPEGEPYVTLQDLHECCALALGSPCRFGNMAAPMKYFWDSTAREWLAGTLGGKPATVFTSSATQHGGNESTLLSMMLPLLHHGMIVMGLDPTSSALATTRSGGSVYGATHVAGQDDSNPITEEERKLCLLQGQRLAELALKLKE
jgi:NAD(P)H dehydrogenase (quinone)